MTEQSRHEASAATDRALWVVRVRVRRSGRVFLFVTPDSTFKVGDRCLVNTDRGLEFGTVVSTPLVCEDQNAERVLTRVVRRATISDEAAHEKNLEFEHEAFEKCRRMIRERGMDMKLVRVESTFDRKKVVFYFSAEDRVDFRELVKDLAAAFRTRIELRQIGVRDEARLVGGLGVCGRPLCCSTFLREFSPVSIRAAKKQNLALNPAKISGLCGRLMCCILFEDAMYDQCPRENGEVPCSECKGFVLVSDETGAIDGPVSGNDVEEPQSAAPAENKHQSNQPTNRRRSKRGRGRRRRKRKSVD